MRFLFSFIFITTFITGQTRDSVLYQLLQIENDTERVNSIYTTGFELRNTDPELAYQYAVQCEKQALKTSSAKHIAKSYNLLGILYYKKGNYSKALDYQQKALRLNQQAGNAHGIAINQVNLGNIYTDLKEQELAEHFYLEALHTYNTLNNTLQMTRCLINIGVLKHQQGQFIASGNQFREALNYAEKLGDYDLMATCNNNIGAVLLDMKKADSALIYLEEGMKLRSLIDNELELADSYLNMAKAYLQLNNFSQADNYLNLAEPVCTHYQYAEALIELYRTRSEYFEKQQNYEQALYWNKKYHAYKDSILTIEKPAQEQEFKNEILHETADHKSALNSKWLLAVLIVLVTLIPLFFIKQKR